MTRSWTARFFFDCVGTILNAATRTGAMVDRWQTVLDVMLEKIIGKPLIEKLRIITLLEADINLALGMLWGRRLIRQGELFQAFHPEQWGSRKLRSAIEAVLMKTFTYQLAELTRTPCGTFDNDAQACYDRIVTSLVNLVSLALGMPVTACTLRSSLLQHFRHRIKTASGISEDEYLSSVDYVLYGECQGTRWAPAAWFLISTLLMSCMPDKSNGLQFLDPQQRTTAARIMDGFVDDTTAWVNDFRRSLQDGYTIHDLRTDLQRTAQWWEELLHATGGRLETGKCFLSNALGIR